MTTKTKAYGGGILVFSQGTLEDAIEVYRKTIVIHNQAKADKRAEILGAKRALKDIKEHVRGIHDKDRKFLLKGRVEAHQRYLTAMETELQHIVNEKPKIVHPVLFRSEDGFPILLDFILLDAFLRKVKNHRVHMSIAYDDQYRRELHITYTQSFGKGNINGMARFKALNESYYSNRRLFDQIPIITNAF